MNKLKRCLFILLSFALLSPLRGQGTVVQAILDSLRPTPLILDSLGRVPNDAMLYIGGYGSAIDQEEWKGVGRWFYHPMPIGSTDTIVVTQDSKCGCSDPNVPKKGMNSCRLSPYDTGYATRTTINFTPDTNLWMAVHWYGIEEIGHGKHEPAYISLSVTDANQDTVVSIYHNAESDDARYRVIEKHLIEVAPLQYMEMITQGSGWQCAFVNLADYVNTPLHIEVISSACSTIRCMSSVYFAFEQLTLTRTCTPTDDVMLIAPAGFTYSWTKDSPTGTPISTDQYILPPADGATYYCRLNDSECVLSIESFLPIAVADFDMDIHRGLCEDTVFLNNTSFISKDGVSPATPFEACTYAFWDFGDGRTSTELQPGYVIYNHKTTGQIKLVAGLELGHCALDSLTKDFTTEIGKRVRHRVDTACYGAVVSLQGYYIPHPIQLTDTLLVDTLISPGCIDTVFVFSHYHIKDAVSTIDTGYCCEGTTYYWRNKPYYRAGIYYEPMISKHECDTARILHLFYGKVYETTETATICNGEVFFWHNNEYRVSGLYTDTLVSMSGCDSITHLDLSVFPRYDRLGNFDKDDPTTWTNPYVDAQHDPMGDVNDPSGWSNPYVTDSLVDISDPSHWRNPFMTEITLDTICEGDNYIWHGKVYNQTGLYKDTLFSIHGCDSVVYLNLHVWPATDSLFIDSICPGDTIEWQGEKYTSPGIYKDTIKNAVGCDSILTLDLRAKAICACDTSRTDTTAYTCYGTPFIWHGKIAQNGDTIVRKNAQGCDSVVTLKLITNPSYDQEVNLTVCDKQLPFTWNGIKCEAAGDYILNSITTLGCDSIVTLHLSVDTYSASDTSAYICYGTPFIWHGKIAQDGDTIRLINSVGCDSIVTLKLFVSEAPVTIPLNDTASCQMVPFMWRGHTIVGDTICYDTIRTTKLGCDSIYASLRFVVKEPSGSDTTAYTCYGTPFIWHGKEAKDGDTIILTNAQGCDSIVTLRLTISAAPITQPFDTVVCDTLMPYTWRGRLYEEPAIYRDTLYNIRGCDSIYRSFSLDTIHCVRPEPPVPPGPPDPPVPPDPPEPECGDSLVYRKWDDVLFCDDGLRQFIAYQWYRNETEMAGETKQYLYLPNGQMGDASYGVVATRRDGTKFISCHKSFYDWPRSADTYVWVQTVVRRGGSLQIDMSDKWAEIELYTMIGQRVMKTTIVGTNCALPITLPTGTYVLRLKGEQVSTITKIMVE